MEATIPKAFESMLKTTTETGDIGLFSIKPSRVHHSLSTPRRIGGNYNGNSVQKPRHNFQPYGVPTIDDRRRLPSYARDVTSEVVSMYETASQKSASRASEDPDCRSYSMTQASHSAYTLSAHRSYVSLINQQHDRGPIQRPRSPFAYPARLRRPGFRPSSPALTDGGVIDYSRRTEIERGPGYNTSSPSSLYAQKRKPPLTLRPEGNRSTPCLLSQSSPRRASSPYVPTSYGSSGHDWNRRHASSSRNTSPARSTFSLASTMNLYASIPASNSTTTTPGKPSPLYYDYTEDFEVENCTQSERLGPPPQFQIDKTIPENVRINSKQGQALQTLTNQPQNTRLSSLPAKNALQEAEGLVQRLSKAGPTNGVGSAPQSSGDEKAPHSQKEAKTDVRDKKVLRLSRLGYGARELSTHVEEAFGLLSSSSFEVLIPDNRPNPIRQSTGESAEPCSSSKEDSISAQNLETVSLRPNPLTQFSRPVLSSDAENELCTQSKELQENTTKHLDTFNSVDTGFTNLADSLRNLEESHKSQVHYDSNAQVIPLRRTLMTSPNLLAEIVLRGAPFSAHKRSPPQAFLYPQEDASACSDRLAPKLCQNQGYRIETSDVPVLKAKSIKSFSHQLPIEGIARSESPMLAPKPISPARQLKLKNSIPQLMKALPPLPLDQLIRVISPSTHAKKELPCRFSPLLTQSFETPSPSSDASVENILLPTTGLLDMTAEKTTNMGVPNWEVLQEVSPHDELPSPLALPKLKLKMRQTSAVRPVAPPESQSWPQAEECPLLDQDSDTLLAPKAAEQKTGVFKHPKFRLKIIRATNSTQGTTPEGTVRVNRESIDSTNAGGIHLPNANDLFSPTPGLENIFRQVSKHIHARKASIVSSRTSNSTPTPAMVQIPDSTHIATMLAKDQTIAPKKHIGSSETRSCFSEDSSHFQGNHSLRKKLSNIRAHMAIPYASKIGTQSYDDITWKDRNVVEIPAPTPARSIPDLQSGRKNIETRTIRRAAEKIHRQRLKTKIQSWVKSAKSAIKARVKARGVCSGSRRDKTPLRGLKL